jgi:hypothetical protein
MPENTLFAEMLWITRMLIDSLEFKILHRMKSEDFSRKGKLGFTHTMLMMLNFFKKSSSIEIYNYFDRIGKPDEAVSRQAFAQAREKISHTAFKMFFEETVKLGTSVENPRLYKWWRLMAIDGSTLMTEKSPELEKYFGPTTPSKGDVFARISMLYDIENGFILDGSIGSYSIGERKMALDQIAKVKSFWAKEWLMLFDRGYWSPSLITAIVGNGGKLLMRVASNISQEIYRTDDTKGYFTVKDGKNRYQLRFYKFSLPNGEIETLVTNLEAQEVSDNELESLYFKRWGIESNYMVLKSLMQMENFTGKSVLSVKQDFYATLYLANMTAFAKMRANGSITEARKDKGLKYEYKANTNLAIGILKDRLIMVMLEEKKKRQAKMLNAIFKAIARNVVPIRPGRQFPRKKSSIKYKRRTTMKTTL